jgi:ketosteroid isomerase-like protein
VLLEADRAFARDVAARRVDGWVDAFASDGRQLTQRGIAAGPDAIRAFMTRVFADPDRQLRWEPLTADVSGALGYTVGRYQLLKAGVVIDSGLYLTVWRRQPDGRWKVAADIGNTTIEPSRSPTME